MRIAVSYAHANEHEAKPCGRSRQCTFRRIGVAAIAPMPPLPLVFLVFLVVLASGATSALAGERDVCAESTGERSIAACTQLIVSGRTTGSELGEVYLARANARRDSRDYDRAIADFTQAIQFMRISAPPAVLASVYVARAGAYALNGGLDNALADYQQALVVDATNEAAAEGVKRIQAALASGQTRIALPDVPPPPAQKPQEPNTVPLESKKLPDKSLWDHNGSVVYLVANGTTRKFFYEQPRAALLSIGITQGRLLFTGRRNGDQYVGVAYKFSAKCRTRQYAVSGPVSADQRQVTLHGTVTRLNSRCQQEGSEEDTLVFTFLGE